jgi:hypothetical protein
MDEGMPHPSEAWYDPDCKLNKNPLNNNMSDPVKEFESLRNDSKLVFAVGELGLRLSDITPCRHVY